MLFKRKEIRKKGKSAFGVMSIRVIIALSLALVAILSISLVTFLLYQDFYKELEIQDESKAVLILRETGNKVEKYFEKAVNVLELISFKLHMGEDINNPEIKAYAESVLAAYNDILFVKVFDGDDNEILNLQSSKLEVDIEIKNDSWYNIAKENPQQKYFYFYDENLSNNKTGKGIAVVGRNITKHNSEYSLEGMIVVGIDNKYIDDTILQTKIGYEGYIYILDEYGNVISHPNRGLMNIGQYSEKTFELVTTPYSKYNFDDMPEKTYYVYQLGYYKWYMVGVSYSENISAVSAKLKDKIPIIIFAGSIIVLILSLIISYQITSPIKRLERHMDKFEHGILEKIEVKGAAEVIHLSNAYNDMVDKLKELMRRVRREEKAKRKFEFSALQEQINPHFLYNTFDSIVWMNEKNQKEKVNDLIMSLSAMLRITLSRGNNIIPIKDELIHAKNYLNIQKIRYGENLNYTLEVDENLLEKVIPKLTLQPFLENAILHGFNGVEGEKLIKISIYAKNKQIIIKVIDNGNGIEDKKLLKINNNYQSKTKAGIGITNVHQRIKLYYGEKYGVKIESELEKGTIITINLPMNKK